ncbi:MAG: hypothetical protein AMXMBFR58_10090 [Phycisphaerae bacterium]|nr:Transcriptional regulator PerR [Phycisphaerales bacterium]
MKPLSIDQIKDLFHEHGLRTTRQRELIYTLLHQSHDHPTAEELFQAARVQDSGLSLATVYNTLDVLVESRLARKLTPAGGGSSRFDADLSDHAHLATTDGKFVDIPEDLSRELVDRIGPDLVGRIESRMGVKVDAVTVSLVVAGLPGH